MERHKKFCKKIAAAGAAMVLVLAAGAGHGESLSAINFSLKELGGRELALKDLRGTIVVMVLGELYQHNTLKAIQDVTRLLAEKSAYRTNVEVLVVVSDTTKRSEYRTIRDNLNISYPILLDEQRSVYAQFEIKAIPTTVIISPEGTVAARLPSYTIAYYDYVDAELGYLRGEVSEEELESILNPRAAEPVADEKAERLLSLADSLRLRGFYDSAIENYLEVLKDSPGLDEAHIGAGTVYVEKKDAQKAEKEFMTVLDKKPDDPAALEGMARVHLLRGEAVEAERLLHKVILSGRIDENTYYVMGEIYEMQGNFKDAAAFYKKSSQRLLKKGWNR